MGMAPESDQARPVEEHELVLRINAVRDALFLEQRRRKTKPGRTDRRFWGNGRTDAVPCRADRVNAKANRPGRNHLVSSYTTDGRSSLEWAGEEVMGWQALDTVGHWEVRTRAQRRKGRGRTWTKQSWKWRRRRRAGRAGLAATCAQVTLRTMDSKLGQLFW